jgi:plasmid maintenance system killer protein
MSRKIRRSAVVAGSLLAAALALPSHVLAQGAAQAPAPTVESVTAHLTQALGGQAAWDSTHYIRFNFLGRREHWWDKWTGRHRLEGDTKEKQHYVVIENVNTKEGTAWLDGKKLEGEKAKEMLDNAYGAWVNDTYWLIMPYKLHDPGVNLAYAGDETIDGKVYDKLGLSFGKVGLTPGDHYTVYVNRATGLVDRWAYILQDMPKDGPATAWQWEGWQKYGHIMLAPHRVQVGGDKKLELTDIAVFDQLPDSVFTSPDKVK